MEEGKDLVDYGKWGMNGVGWWVDGLGGEVNVSGVSDDKGVMMIRCEGGGYKRIDLGWIVWGKKGVGWGGVGLGLGLKKGEERNEVEVMKGRFDEKWGEVVRLGKGGGLRDCGIEGGWGFEGEGFGVVG